MKKIILVIIFFLLSINAISQRRDSVLVDRGIFTVMYSETLEQPLWVKYSIKNPKQIVSRKGLDFYTEGSYHTSDSKDYDDNVWDKGHLAPAAHFSNNKEELLKTFTYLNCGLQHNRLNRGVWRVLEANERIWSRTERLDVEVRVKFSSKSVKLPTGVVVPDGYYKKIRFENGKVMCFYFPNKASTKKWNEYQIECK